MTGPYFVLTVLPSTIGKRSLCTPSRDTSGPWVLFLPAILSISSKKMIPDCSTFWMARFTTLSISTSPCASSWARISMASGTFILRRFVPLGNMPPSISLKLIPISSMPTLEKISTMGRLRSATSRSTNRLSSFPCRSMLRSFSRVDEVSSAPGVTSSNWTSFGSSLRGAGVLSDFGSSRSSIRSSAICEALLLTASCSLAFNVFMVSSSKSLTIDSTSRPTYPTSVNLEASTFEKGESVSRDNRLAISVLPTPVGPITMIFFGAISSRRSAETCCRRQRFLNAIATERLALS